MYTFLITLIIICAVLLVLVVLAQNSEGGGLSSQFGGSGASQIVGVKRTGDILEKITWVLAILIVVLSMTSTVLLKKEIRTGSRAVSPNLEKAEKSALPNMDNSSILQAPADSAGGNGAAIEQLQEGDSTK